MLMFQHTAARRRLGRNRHYGQDSKTVSTHSRPKAAGCYIFCHVAHFACFNTQPPEGGWRMTSFLFLGVSVFQHTAARRRLAVPNASLAVPNTVSTHSRPKAAGYAVRFIRLLRIVSTHSRPKAAGYLPKLPDPQLYVSTHSRPKAAGFSILTNTFNVAVSTHSRPKAAGVAGMT